MIVVVSGDKFVPKELEDIIGGRWTMNTLTTPGEKPKRGPCRERPSLWGLATIECGTQHETLDAILDCLLNGAMSHCNIDEMYVNIYSDGNSSSTSWLDNITLGKIVKLNGEVHIN